MDVAVDNTIWRCWTSAADFETKRQKHSCGMLIDKLIMYCIWHHGISDGTAYEYSRCSASWKGPATEGCEIWFWPLMTRPLLRTAPRVMRSSVEMTGITELPSGMRATLENRKIAASKLLKKVLAPAKKKLPAHTTHLHTDCLIGSEGLKG